MGFQVFDGLDLKRTAMEDVMVRFARAASKAKVALAYYAGHGVRVDGANYLIPVDAVIQDDADLIRQIRLDDMIRDTARADRLAVVVVDACRDNPFVGEVAAAAGPGPLAGQRQGPLARAVQRPGTAHRRAVADLHRLRDRPGPQGRGRRRPQQPVRRGAAKVHR